MQEQQGRVLEHPADTPGVGVELLDDAGVEI
jgi:hypothetical protein